jgi:hypothetical protein
MGNRIIGKSVYVKNLSSLYVMDYKQLSNTIYPDLVDYILNKHGKEMRKFYQTCVDEYLNEEFGELHSGPRNKLTKELMNQLIS